MTQNFTNIAPAGADAHDGGITLAPSFHGQTRRKGMRGLFALGFLIFSAAVSYAAVFILIDMWYKGGSLGIF